MWVSIPGPAKTLSLCEVAVYQRKPFVWRQLSGVAEVAQGKKSEQSTAELGGNGGDSSRAVDGDTSNNDYNRGSCTATQAFYVTVTTPWWMVDLGQSYDVRRIQLWPRTVSPHDRTVSHFQAPTP